MSTTPSAAISIPSLQIRTDVSATLFISAPEDYDGGELMVEDTYGSHAVKLPAGDMIVYPGTSLHNVTPITRGSRIASFFWTQSLIRDETKRALLFDLDMAIRRLAADHPEHASVVSAHLDLSQPAAAMGRGVRRRDERGWDDASSDERIAQKERRSRKLLLLPQSACHEG